MPNLNGIECGGSGSISIRRCMDTTRRTSAAAPAPSTIPGPTGAASKPGVCHLDHINWTNAKIAIETGAAAARTENGHLCRVRRRQHDTSSTSPEDHRSDRRRVQDHAGRCHLRPPYRQDGGDKDADRKRRENSSNSIRRSGAVTGNDTYEIVQHFLPGQYGVVQPGGMGDEAPLPVRTRLPER